jgi:hypothetical protein
MTPRRRKSTKRSAANFRSQRKSAEVAILVDECLGRFAVPEALKAAWARVVLHSEMFPSGVDDQQWLRALAGRGDISVISKDRQIRKRTLEHEAVIAGRVRLFTLTSAGMNSREQADAFVRALRRIQRCSQQPGPFIAVVTARGGVRIVIDGRPEARAKGRTRRQQPRKK